MTQSAEISAPSTPATSPAAHAPQGGEAGLNDRAQALLARMAEAGDTVDVESPDVEEAADANPGTISVDAEDETKPAAPQAKNAQRLADIARLERERVNGKQQKRQASTQRELEVAQRAQQLDQMHQQIAAREKIWDDPIGLLDMLEQKVGVDKLIEYVKTAKSPEKLAARELKKDLDPIAKELAALKAENEKFKHAQTTAAAEGEFKGIIAEFAATDVPLTSNAMKANEREVMGMAHVIADGLRASGQPFNLHDVALTLERRLAHMRDMLTGSTGTDPNDETTRTQEQQNGAAGKAKTLSNRVASGRTSIAANTGPRMSLEDRAAAAKRRLQNS